VITDVDHFPSGILEPADTNQRQGCAPKDDFHVPVAVSAERSPGIGNQSPPVAKETPSKTSPHDDESVRMTWLLGDDGLDQSTSIGHLHANAVSTTSNDAATLAESGTNRGGTERFDVRAKNGQNDGRTLADQAVEELIGSSSPLAYLPTETDVDALIELLRTSPSSSKPISHASTLSINDILDNDPDLDQSLSSLVDGPFFDIADVQSSDNQMCLERPKGDDVTKFRNDGFDFGFYAFEESDRPAEQLRLSIDGAATENKTKDDQKDMEKPVDLEEMAVKELVEICQNSSTDDSLFVVGRQDTQQHEDICEIVGDPNENQVVDSTRDGLNEVAHHSDVMVEKPDRLENPNTVTEAVDVASNPASPDDENSSLSSDSTCRHVERVDHNAVDGHFPVKSTVAHLEIETKDNKSRKHGVNSRKLSLQKLDDILSKENCDSKVPPIVRRKSCEWATSDEIPRKSVVDVGQDKVTALTSFFEQVHADQCPGCSVCDTGIVQRPFSIQRQSSLPVDAKTGPTSFYEFVPGDGHRHANNFAPKVEQSAACVTNSSIVVDIHKQIAAMEPEPVVNVETAVCQMSNSLPRHFSQTATSSVEQKNDISSDLRQNSLPRATSVGGHAAVSKPDDQEPTTSRRVVSLPDMSGESVKRSREGRRQAEFRFRVARIRSHSLRSFSDIAASGIGKRPITSRVIVPASNQRPVQNFASPSEEYKHKINSEGNTVQSNSIEPSVETIQSSVDGSTDGVMGNVETASKTADRMSLDTFLAEICTPTVNATENGSSLTPDMIQKYQIEPKRRDLAPRRLARPEQGTSKNRRPNDDVSRRKHSGLEQRIDAMLFDVDRRWSDDEQSTSHAQQNVLRTRVPVLNSETDFNSPLIRPTQPVSHL